MSLLMTKPTDAQADLSLRWAQSHFVGFVMSRLKSRTSSNCSNSGQIGLFMLDLLALECRNMLSQNSAFSFVWILVKR